MTKDSYSLPAERSLPPGHLAGRRDHLVHELRVAGHSRRADRRRSRYVVAGFAAGAAALLAAPAFGLGERLLDVFRGNPNAPTVDARQAERVLVVNASPGKEAMLWRASTKDGGECVFIQVADAGAPAQSAAANGGGLCRIGTARRPQSAPIQTFLSWVAADNGYMLIVHGHVAASSRIATVQLVSATDSTVLSSRAGYFLGRLPASDEAGELPAQGRPFVIVGYDRAGLKVAQVDLQKLIAESTP